MNNGPRALIGVTAALLAVAVMPAAAATADSSVVPSVVSSVVSPVVSSVASTAVVAPQTWGPYHSPGGRRARAAGTVTATGEDHEVIPSAATLTVSGVVTDLARSRSRCGWVVFGIATVNAAGNRITWKRHHERTCAYRTPKRFSFTYHRVYQVELKVCSERRGRRPSIQCTAGNPTWKDIYTSPH